MKRKLLCLLLCFSILLSLSPVFAADEPYDPFFLVIEGESGEAVINDGFAVTEDERASNGAVMKSVKGSTEVPPREETPSLSYRITVPEAGVYNIYMRYGIFEPNSESIFYQINGSDYTMLYLSEKEEYQWRNIKTKLQAGENTLNFRYRKARFCIDKFIITNAVGYYPLGMGQEPTDPWTKKDYNQEQTLYSSIAMPPYIPAGRPRVTVTEKDIPLVKSQLTHPQNADSYHAVLTAADYEATECDLVPVTGNSGNNLSIKGLGYIESNAFLYLINGDVQRGRKAVDGLFRYLNTLDISNMGVEFQGRNGGFVLYVAAQTYDWCYPLLTEEERRQIITLGLGLMQGFEYGWPPDTSEKAYASGHAVECDFMKNILAFGIAVYDEYPEIYNIVGGRIFNEFIPTKNYFYDSSSFNHQGTNYSAFRFTFELYMTWLLDKIGAGGLVSSKQREYLYGNALTRLPDGTMFKSGDYNNEIGVYSAGHKASFFLAANYYKDPFLKQEYFKCTQGKGETSWSYLGVTPVDYLLMNDTSLGVDSLKKFPQTTYLGDQTGVMVARTGWDEGINSNAMVAFLSMPEKFFKGHMHYDSGGFQIYYKGKLALKSGVYNLFGSAHDYGYQKQSIASNCMLIQNPDNDLYYSGNYPLMGGQALDSSKYDFVNSFEGLKGDKTTIGEILGYDYGEDPFTPSFSYLKGDITDAYNGNAKDYTRSFVFLNFFDEVYPGALIVFDKVTAEPQFKKTWLLHSQEEPEINGSVTTIRRTENGYDGRLVNETLLPRPADAKLSKIGGEGAEYYAGNQNYPDITVAEGGKWRVELTPKSVSETDYFLNVLQVGDNGGNAEPLSSILLENENYAGVQIRDRVAWLNKGKTRGTTDVTVGTAEGSKGTFTFMVDGLYPGKWNIQKDGKVIGTAEASENSGVLSFTAEAGNYTLSYQSVQTTEKNFDIIQINPDVATGICLNYNGQYYDLPTPVLYENGKIYVPVEAFASLVGAECSKAEEGGSVLTMDSESVSLSEKELLQRFDASYTAVERLTEALGLEYEYIEYANIMKLVKHEYITIEGEQIKNSSDSSRIPLIRVQSESGDPSPTVDEDYETSWVQEGERLAITYEFEKSENIRDIKVMWRQGNLRKIYYEVHTSEDGKNYSKVFDGASDGVSEGLESLGGTPCRAKYVKLVMKGNSQNNWNGIHQVEFYR